MINPILDARENRVLEIQSLLSCEGVLICIKANIPGDYKNIDEAHILVRLFTLLIQKQYELKSIQHKNSADGPYSLLVVNSKNKDEIKQDAILLEDTHPLGRFIDLDVYYQQHHSISRASFDLPNRKCYLCGEDAHICSRTQKHSILSLISFIQFGIKSFLRYQIEHHIHEAIIKELDLENKFGLVSKSSNGSHIDMNYQLMKDAENAILPYMVDLFIFGYEAQELNTLLANARLIGISAEKQMFQATHGVNAYKGLIYLLGLALLSFGYALKHQQEFIDIFENIKMMTKSIYEEFEQEPLTAGLSAYKEHKITGIRGEAYRGMPSVKSALELLTDENESTLRAVLKHLILVSEDTVFLKRAKSIENYHQIKEILKKTNISDPKHLETFNQLAIKENLSFGGSADLLIVTIFLKSIKSDYFK